MLFTRRSVLIITAVLLFSEGCRDSGEEPRESPPLGMLATSYSYKAYRGDGSLAVSGTLVLSLFRDSSLTGNWTFVSTSGGTNVGPQVGSGRLAGNNRNGKISVNLNPDWVDNNVFLYGVIGSSSISGTWTWSTFTGPTSSGRFEASPLLVR